MENIMSNEFKSAEFYLTVQRYCEDRVIKGKVTMDDSHHKQYISFNLVRGREGII